MKRKLLSLITAILSICMILMLIGCGGSDDSSGSSADADQAETTTLSETNTLEAAGSETGQIVYYSGIVDLRRNGETAWEPADIGDEVQSGDTIRTLTDGWCEIQFGSLAVVKVDGDTVFTINGITDKDSGAGSLNGTLSSGTVVSKIRKLTGNESMSIKTPTVICSVRGTVFMVTTETDATTVAVDEGSVAIAPAALAEEDGTASLSIDTDTANVLEASFPVLEAGSQVVLGAREIDIIESEVTSILESAKSGDSQSVAVSADRIGEALGGLEELDEENQEAMKSMERLDVGNEAVEAGEILIKMSWEVTPSDTAILLDGTEGIGSISGSWKTGETIQLEASRPGYQDFRAEYTVQEGTAEVIQVALSRLPTRYFDLAISPSEAEVTVDGDTTTGSLYRGAVPWGESRDILVTMEGHNSHHYVFSHEDAPEGSIDVILEPTIQSTVPAVTGAVIGLAEANGLLYLSDHEGTLFALNTNGERIWRRVTANSPNDAARPHIVGDRVFFSGINEFIVVNAATGRIEGQSGQTPQSMHLLGRRSVSFKNKAIYPATDELRYVDPADGRILDRIPIPGGSQMTPVVYRNQVWTVSVEGTVYGFAEDGSVAAQIATGANKPIAHAPALAGGTIWFGDRAGKVFAVDLDARKLSWETSIGGSEPTPVSDDVHVDQGIVLAYSKGTAYLLDAFSGRPVSNPITGYSAPPVLLDGFVYGGTETGELTACIAASGEEVARVPMNGIVKSNATIQGNRIVFGTDQGEVYFVNPQHPSLLEAVD